MLIKLILHQDTYQQFRQEKVRITFISLSLNCPFGKHPAVIFFCLIIYEEESILHFMCQRSDQVIRTEWFFNFVTYCSNIWVSSGKVRLGGMSPIFFCSRLDRAKVTSLLYRYRLARHQTTFFITNLGVYPQNEGFIFVYYDSYLG